MMTRPLLVLFANDHDVAHLNFLINNLEFYRSCGYDTITIEAKLNGQNPLDVILESIEEQENIKSQAEEYLKLHHIKKDLESMSFLELKNYMQLYVSTQYFHKIALDISSLPAARRTYHLLDKAEKLGMTIQDIDNRLGDSVREACIDSKKHFTKVEETLAARDENFVNQLVRLQAAGRNCIAIHGTSHAKGMVEGFKARQMEKRVLCYAITGLNIAAKIDNSDPKEMLKALLSLVPNELVKTIFLNSPGDAILFQRRVIRDLEMDSRSASLRFFYPKELSALAQTCKRLHHYTQDHLKKLKR